MDEVKQPEPGRVSCEVKLRRGWQAATGSVLELYIPGLYKIPPLKVWQSDKKSPPTPLTSKQLYELVEMYGLYVTKTFPTLDVCYSKQALYRSLYNNRWLWKPAPPLPPPLSAVNNTEQEELKWEVDMVTPLVGWRSWVIRVDYDYTNQTEKGKTLSSVTRYNECWLPLTPMEARCSYHAAPAPQCSCGIHARESATWEYLQSGSNTVYGEVYLWGRYIRGENGYRAQFAYPKQFIVFPTAVEQLEFLKEWRVPVYVMDPLRLYDPAEEGWYNPAELTTSEEDKADDDTDNIDGYWKD